MNFHNFILQFAFLYAPLIHQPTQMVTANLYRGQDPKIKQIYVLHDKGIKSIISLRLNPERKKQRLCEKLDMKWFHIPTGVFSTPTDDQFDQFRALVKDPKNQPCYVSCEVDMDRVGVYLAAYQLVDRHWTMQAVEEEYKTHHQKTWWPIFRKYKKVVMGYAERRGATLL